MAKGKKGSVIEKSEVSEKSEIKEEMEKTKMSKEETKTEETPKVEVQEYKIAAKYFDLNTFEKKSKEIPVSFTPAADYQEAFSRLGNDTKVLTAVLNKELQRIVEQDARKEIASEGVPYKVVMDFIKSFRMGKPFSDFVTVEKGKSKDWKPQYDLQTEKILEEVKKHEFLMNQIRANAANFTGDDDEE